MTPDFEARWEAYQRRQSEGGYVFFPGDEHIFRDAWNMAIEEAAQACERSQSRQGMRPHNDGPNAARRNCAIIIRGLKSPPVKGDSK